MVEPYIRGKAIRYLEEGKVVIRGRHGQPVLHDRHRRELRGREVEANIVLKATKVDGVYTADPMKDKTATRYQNLTFDEAFVKNLKVMDAGARALPRPEAADQRVLHLQGSA